MPDKSKLTNQIKVTLRGIKPPIWRRLRVPGNIRLVRLHEVLQIAMGWSNSHLHLFEKVVSLGDGGLLILCEPIPPLGAEVQIDFAVWGLGGEFPVGARGKVVWTQPGKVGLEFIGEPDGLKVLLIFLERESTAAGRVRADLARSHSAETVIGSAVYSIEMHLRPQFRLEAKGGETRWELYSDGRHYFQLQ